MADSGEAPPPASPVATTKVDRAKVEAWFAQHWKEPFECPVSRETAWTIGEDFAHTPVFSPGGINPPSTFPAVVVLCSGCGYTMLFNAMVMGLLPPPKGARHGE